MRSKEAWYKDRDKLEYFMKWYPHIGAQNVSKELNVPEGSIRNYAWRRGIKMLPRNKRICSLCKINFVNKRYGGNRCFDCYCLKNRESKDIRKNNQPVVEKIRELMQAIKSRCKKSGKEYNITLDYILSLYKSQNGKCFYTGITLKPGSLNDDLSKKYDSISFDRIDPRKGYIEGNIVLASFWANTAKYNLSTEDFIKMCKLVIINTEGYPNAE